MNGVDVGWHGTFVAGLAAASTSKGIGVARVAWGCRVMPLMATDWQGTIWLDAVAAGFDDAIAKGAQVLNLSMGTTDPAAAAIVRSRFPALDARQAPQQWVVDGDAHADDNPIGPRLNLEKALTYPLDAAPAAPPATMAFAPPSPDPARGSVRFAFALPRSGRATLRVLDAQGRLVRVVADGPLAAGAQSVAWDGSDGSGRAAAAGLYFAEHSAGAVRVTRRFAVLH